MNEYLDEGNTIMRWTIMVYGGFGVFGLILENEGTARSVHAAQKRCLVSRSTRAALGQSRLFPRFRRSAFSPALLRAHPDVVEDIDRRHAGFRTHREADHEGAWLEHQIG